MNYLGWTISAHTTFLGWFAQYTSPIGQTHQTSCGFPTEQLVLAYAQGMIEFLRGQEQVRFADQLCLAPGGKLD